MKFFGNLGLLPWMESTVLCPKS